MHEIYPGNPPPPPRPKYPPPARKPIFDDSTKSWEERALALLLMVAQESGDGLIPKYAGELLYEKATAKATPSNN